MKIIGISGPSCCGKSTLSRTLRLVLPNASILYQDDFYKPESELPLDSKGRPNWDAPESFDLLKMRTRLLQLKQRNQLPKRGTREDFNNVASPLLDSASIEKLRSDFAQFDEPVLLVDGILLFQKDNSIDDLFDLKILMPFDYATLKSRREARTGYATADGEWWVDPPHFFEQTIWPEFLKYCGWLYDHDGTKYSISAEARNRQLIMPSTSDLDKMIREVMKTI